MIDHVKLHVADAERSKAFYSAALAPLGYRLVLAEGPTLAYRARDDEEAFALRRFEGPIAPVHVAFTAAGAAAVDAFHAAALAAGGRDNGGPGLRPQYHPGYYGAFVFDPDGNNVEAVHHTFE